MFVLHHKHPDFNYKIDVSPLAEKQERLIALETH